MGDANKPTELHPSGGSSARPPHPTDPGASQSSIANVHILSGSGMTLWCDPSTMLGSLVGCSLRLDPDRPVIIGRQEGSEIPYLDPSYRATPLLPETGKSILRSGGKGEDAYVSRGHFMLRACSGGILFVTGVPQR